MDLTRIETVVRKERQKSELNPLDESFYKEVRGFLEVLYKERERAAERAEDPFSSDEVKQVTDKIETVEETIESLYERRSGKIVKAASFASAGMAKQLEGATTEEKELFDNLVDELNKGRENVLDTIDTSTQTTESDDVSVSKPVSNDKKAVGNDSEKTLDASAVMGGSDEESIGQQVTDVNEERFNTKEESVEENEKTEGEYDDGIERTTVRITREVGEIVGTDNREYYLYEDNVITLPEQNADILMEKDAAIAID